VWGSQTYLGEYNFPHEKSQEASGPPAIRARQGANKLAREPGQEGALRKGSEGGGHGPVGLDQIHLGQGEQMSDEKEAPPAPKAKPVRYGFSCGSGPCRTFRVYENEPEKPKLPALAEPDKAD